LFFLELRDCILCGDIQSAVQILQQHFQNVLQNYWQHSPLIFQLQCQVFVELIRQNNIEGAIGYAQAELHKWMDFKDFNIGDVVGLLAYNNPFDSPLAHLFNINKREHLADIVNDAIMGQQQSVLEQLLRQSLASQKGLMESRLGHLDNINMCIKIEQR